MEIVKINHDPWAEDPPSWTPDLQKLRDLLASLNELPAIFRFLVAHKEPAYADHRGAFRIILEALQKMEPADLTRALFLLSL